MPDKDEKAPVKVMTPEQLTPAQVESLMPTEVNEIEMDLADEAAPHVDFFNLGFFEGKKIDFPKLDKYDFDHGSAMQRMCWFILSVLEPGVDGKLEGSDEVVKVKPPNDKCVVDTFFNQRVLWLASYLCHMGRTKEGMQPDPGCTKRSEKIARAFFAYDGNKHLADDPKLVASVLDAINMVEDPGTNLHAAILHDAVLLEEARFLPNTKSGAVWVKGKYAKMKTPAGRSKQIQKDYMKYCGWMV